MYDLNHTAAGMPRFLCLKNNARRSAVNLALDDLQGTPGLHRLHGAYHRFYPQAGHVGNLLPGKCNAVALAADIFLCLFKIIKQGSDAAFRIVVSQFF